MNLILLYLTVIACYIGNCLQVLLPKKTTVKIHARCNLLSHISNGQKSLQLKFQEALTSVDIQKNLSDLANSDIQNSLSSLDNAVDKLKDIIISAATKSFKKIPK